MWNRAVTAVLLLTIATTFCSCSSGTDTRPELTSQLAEADELFRNRDYAEAGTLYESVAERAEAAGDNEAYVEAAAMRARTLLATGDPERGRPWLDRAAAAATDSEPEGWSRYLSVRGRFSWKAGDLEDATRTFEEMFLYCEDHELWERAVDAANMAAITSGTQDRFEWSRRGIETAERGGMSDWLGPLWNNLGWNYYDEEMYDEAYDALVQAREYHRAGTNELPKLIADYSVAHLLMKRGLLEKARAEMTKVLDWAAEMDEGGSQDGMEWMGFSRWDLGEIALASGERSRGLKMMETALEELEAAGMPEWDPDQWAEKQTRLEEVR